MLTLNRRLKWPAIVALVFTTPIVVSILRGQTPAPDNNPPVASAQSEHPKVDPVAVNGPIFVDWPKPDVALVFSGEQNGYLEPCGCAGLENQKGGLKRRFTFLKQLRDKGWNVVAMDLGGQEIRTGIQAEMKVDFTFRVLMKMGYTAVGIGAPELTIDLLPIVINLDAATNPLVSANVGIVSFDSGLSKLYKIVEVGGMRIGITSVLGKKEIAGRTERRRP